MKRLRKTHPGLLEHAFGLHPANSGASGGRRTGHFVPLPHDDLGRLSYGTYHIYGHIHNQTVSAYWPLLAGMDRALNAGVEVNHYQPVTLEELKANNAAFRQAHSAGKPDSVAAYFALAQQRPDLFTPSSQIPLVMDPDRMRAFSAETGRPMGLVYDNRPYFMVLADLCTSGTRSYAYARVVYPQAGTNGAVAVPFRDGKFGLLRIFRHAPRTECLEFPRGFACPGLTPEENIRKELAEEMGAQIKAVRFLGHVRRTPACPPDVPRSFWRRWNTPPPRWATRESGI